MGMEKVKASASAREPRQERSRQRFEAILEKADELIAERGLSCFSIPQLAKALDFNRRTIYAYFPSTYAILNTLLERYSDALFAELKVTTRTFKSTRIDEQIREGVFAATRWHNRYPASRLLMLGGKITDRGYRIQEALVKKLAQQGSFQLAEAGFELPQDKVGISEVAVEMGMSCLRISQHQHGYIQAAYAAEAVYVIQLYFHGLLDGFPRPERAALRRQSQSLLIDTPHRI